MFRAAPLIEQIRLLAKRGGLDVDQPPTSTNTATDPFADLGISPREAEVLALLAIGLTNRQIADQLYISDKQPACTSHT